MKAHQESDSRGFSFLVFCGSLVEASIMLSPWNPEMATKATATWLFPIFLMKSLTSFWISSNLAWLVDGHNELLETEGVGEESVLSGLAVLGDTSLELSGTGGTSHLLKECFHKTTCKSIN